MNEEAFEQFLAQCADALKHKQAQLETEYGLAQMGRWHLDRHSGVLDFFDQQGRLRWRFPTIPIGTWAADPETWKWAWANKHIEQPWRLKAEPLKALQGLTDYEFFADPEPLAADDIMAWELAAAAVQQLQALGCYRAANRDTYLFLALLAPESVT